MTLAVAQIVVSILLIALILIQERSSGLSGILGTGGEGGFYHTRRGLEKFVFWSTILMTVVFIALALANLLI